MSSCWIVFLVQIPIHFVDVTESTKQSFQSCSIFYSKYIISLSGQCVDDYRNSTISIKLLSFAYILSHYLWSTNKIKSTTSKSLQLNISQNTLCKFYVYSSYSKCFKFLAGIKFHYTSKIKQKNIYSNKNHKRSTQSYLRQNNANI